MKKLASLLVVAGVTTLTSMQVNAQSKSFEGAYGQVGIGYESVTPSLTNYSLTTAGTSYPFGTSASNANSFTGTATIGYTFKVNQQFLLGLGAEYSPFAGQSANYTLTNPNLIPSTYSSSYKKNNSYNIFISPGTPIGADGLLYAKVGYTGAQIKDNADGSTANYTGYSLGLGYKQYLTGNIYGFAEGNYFSYGNKSDSSSGTFTGSGASYVNTGTTSANAYNLMVGVGYKF